MQPLDPKLENSWYWISKQTTLLCSPTFTKIVQAQLFQTAISHTTLKKPYRLMSCHLGWPTTEWNEIENHLIFLRAQNNNDWSLLSLPTLPFYIPKNQPIESEFVLKDIHQLTHLFNSEGLSLYCYWISLDIQNILSTIPLEAMELYTLEAALKDFIHEQTSAWLLKNENICREAVLKVGKAKEIVPNENNLILDQFECEKQLMRARVEIKKSLLARLVILKKIHNLIKKDDEEIYNPLLKPLKTQSHLLSILLSHCLEDDLKLSWAQQLQLIQLLNESLGVLTGIHCGTGNERTLFGFALAQSTSIIQEHQTPDRVLSQIMDKNNPNTLMQKELLVSLKKYCLPLMKNTYDLSRLEGFRINQEWLRLLPPQEEVIHDHKKIIHPLVTLDSNQVPNGLTNYGHEIMMQLGG